MPIPESISVIYNDHVPLAPRLDQDGIEIVAGTVASAPVALPGEPGDIMSLVVKGEYDVQFKLVSNAGGRATSKSETVFAGTKELFAVPALPNRTAYISVISPDGDSRVVINCHTRGT